MSHDQRHFSRLPMDTAATFHCQNHSWPAQLVDISLQGALIGCPIACTELVPGTPSRLRIFLDAAGDAIDMEGTIAHVRPGYLGFHCEHIDLDSAAHLRRMLELNLGADKVERELGELLALTEHR